jgi:RimJ/RimL family protein N-acetyltransferase
MLSGAFCKIEPLDSDRHAEGLFQSVAVEQDESGWTYLPYGPFESVDDYRRWVTGFCLADDPLFFAIVDPLEGRPMGVASYLRIAPDSGSIEVGHLHYSLALRQRPAATEAMFLMMRYAFELGYRRYEWKCDALNQPSRVSAQRLGFSFEGLFRQATVYKGRSRDTAWYSVTDSEWPALEAVFHRWLDPANFDEHGNQCTRLSDLTRPLLRPSVVERDSNV